MKRLHLIVHKSMIEEELKSKLTPEEKIPRLKKVLDCIKNVEISEKNVMHLIYDANNLYETQKIHNAANICKGYNPIMLYGISTSVCLPYIKKNLEKEGYDVQYNQEGVID